MTHQDSIGKNLTKKRQPTRIAGKLDRKLFTYAVAATAAGVGVAAATSPANAEVVATPANISVPHNGGLIQFDINRDGQMDFGLSWRSGVFAPHHKTCSTNCPPPTSSRLKVVPAQAANEVWQVGSKAGFFGSSSYCAAALGPGRRVGPAAKFTPGNKGMFWYYQFFGGGFSACKWTGAHPPKAYLGVEFLDNAGALHYGWVRISIGSGGVTITGYAYETTPNEGINTGVTHGPVEGAAADPSQMQLSGPTKATLGLLAVGAPGLAAWRRDEELQAA